MKLTGASRQSVCSEVLVNQPPKRSESTELHGAVTRYPYGRTPGKIGSKVSLSRATRYLTYYGFNLELRESAYSQWEFRLFFIKIFSEGLFPAKLSAQVWAVWTLF